MDTKTQTCETIIGHIFKNKLLVQEALQTAGTGPVPKNTRLAVYGDAALTMMLCRQWYNMSLSKGDYNSGRGSTLRLSF
jgi:hypothetical protein